MQQKYILIPEVFKKFLFKSYLYRAHFTAGIFVAE